MISPKWDAFLTVHDFHPYPLERYPKLLEMFENRAVSTEDLVIVEIETYHGN